MHIYWTLDFSTTYQNCFWGCVYGSCLYISHMINSCRRVCPLSLFAHCVYTRADLMINQLSREERAVHPNCVFITRDAQWLRRLAKAINITPLLNCAATFSDCASGFLRRKRIQSDALQRCLVYVLMKKKEDQLSQLLDTWWRPGDHRNSAKERPAQVRCFCFSLVILKGSTFVNRRMFGQWDQWDVGRINPSFVIPLCFFWLSDPWIVSKTASD